MILRGCDCISWIYNGRNCLFFLVKGIYALCVLWLTFSYTSSLLKIYINTVNKFIAVKFLVISLYFPIVLHIKHALAHFSWNLLCWLVAQETSPDFLLLVQSANNISASIAISTFMRAYITAQDVRVPGILSQYLLPNDCNLLPLT